MARQVGIHKARTAARRKALQLIFQSEITGQPTAEIIGEGLYVEEVGLPCDYTRLLLDGLEQHRPEIDALIEATSRHWTLSRMPLVDRSILGLATYEMLYCTDVPTSVSINEAIELARRFGGEDDSPRFINGVLGKIAERLEGGAPAADEGDDGGADVAAAAAPVLAAADTPAAAPVEDAAASIQQERKAVHG